MTQKSKVNAKVSVPPRSVFQQRLVGGTTTVGWVVGWLGWLVGWLMFYGRGTTLPETNSQFAPENRQMGPKRKRIVCQPSIFRGYDCFRQGMPFEILLMVQKSQTTTRDV